MHLNHLSLTNFRNYVRLELDLPDRITVIQGANAQGKTNLLEAIHLLATGRSPLAGAERELLNWMTLEGPLPYARLTGEVGVGKDVQKLELVLELAPNGGAAGPVVRKQVRINGVPKRALDLVGRLRVVLFLPQDVSLVDGAPAERRRYLDIALCQIAPSYCRALSEYNRVIAQRNALLRRLKEQGGDPSQLTFWDEQLAENGSVLIHRRGQAICDLDRIAAGRHLELTGGAERLRLDYLPSPDPALPAQQLLSGQAHLRTRRVAEARPAYAMPSRAEIAQHFAAGLRAARAREIAAGTSLLGPHRDDIAFAVDGRDLRAFGSRGQQRTTALALKLAEVRMMWEVTGENPLLLLDDVMSELDAARRHALLDALTGVDQAVITTTDWGDFTPELLAQACRRRLEQGALRAA